MKKTFIFDMDGVIVNSEGIWEKYEKQFSAYIKNNLDPENLEKHFEEIRSKIKYM